MAVFGVPGVHEDDALRAVRAAARCATPSPSSASQARIGVNTGEVVVGDGRALATGDAVNVAARLEQAAGAGRDPDRRRDARGSSATRSSRAARAARAEGQERARRRVSAARRRPGGAGLRAPPRRAAGRPRARARRGSATRSRSAVRERACQLFTLLGAGGRRQVAPRRPSCSPRRRRTVVRGRCLPYGEGITYWPLVEILKQLPARQPADPARSRRSSAARRGEPPATPSEIAWAVRKLLEADARERRSSSSSTTSTGPSRPSSTSSSTSPISRATRRCCCSASRGRSCWTRARTGAAAS